MLRFITLFLGVLFISLAILGIIPALRINGLLFGWFSVSFFYTIFHLCTGLLAILCSLRGRFSSKMFLFFVGACYAFLGCAGLYSGESLLFRVVPVNTTDNVFHIGIAALFLYLASFFYKK